MKRLFPLVVIYVIFQQGLDRRVGKAILPDDQPIESLIQDKQKGDPSLTYTVVDQSTFDAIPDRIHIEDIARQKDIQQAITDIKTKGLTTDQKVDALIKYLFP